MLMGFLPKLKIAHKLPMAVLLSALVVSGGVGGASYFIAQNTVVELTQQRLANAVAERGAEVATYLTSIKDDLLTRAGESTAVTIHDFEVSWGQIKTGVPSEVLRQAYIDNNPNPPGERILLDSAISQLTYNFMHRKVHPSFRKLIEKRGYYDLFLFDEAGNAVYTAYKEDDFAQNFSEGGGPYADTELGKVYRAAAAMQEPGQVAFSDFQHYAPSAGAPALFMATPVFDDHGRKQGVIALQLPLDKINAMLNSTAGVGETGEVFLVGTDGLRRNDSHHTTEDDTLNVSYQNPLVDQAFAGQSGSGEGTNEENAETSGLRHAVEHRGCDVGRGGRAGKERGPRPAHRYSQRHAAGRRGAAVAGGGCRVPVCPQHHTADVPPDRDHGGPGAGQSRGRGEGNGAF